MIVNKTKNSDVVSDFSRLDEYNLDNVWYEYQVGGYEGSGWMLVKKDNLYDLHNMGHCSCYDELDQFTFNPKPIEELIKSCSEEVLEQSKSVFELAFSVTL